MISACDYLTQSHFNKKLQDSGLDILDQYKEKTPKDKTIAEKFNNYHFADYKEQVIKLLMQVCYVSVEIMKLIEQIKLLSPYS